MMLPIEKRIITLYTNIWLCIKVATVNTREGDMVTGLRRSGRILGEVRVGEIACTASIVGNSVGEEERDPWVGKGVSVGDGDGFSVGRIVTVGTGVFVGIITCVLTVLVGIGVRVFVGRSVGVGVGDDEGDGIFVGVSVGRGVDVGVKIGASTIILPTIFIL